LPYQSPRELDELQEEFTMYQLLQEEEIPKEVWVEALVYYDDEKSYHRMDIIWNFLSNMKLPDGSLCYKRLSCISKLILVLPHSNAEEERLFSIVRKTRQHSNQLWTQKEHFQAFLPLSLLARDLLTSLNQQKNY